MSKTESLEQAEIAGRQDSSLVISGAASLVVGTSLGAATSLPQAASVANPARPEQCGEPVDQRRVLDEEGQSDRGLVWRPAQAAGLSAMVSKTCFVSPARRSPIGEFRIGKTTTTDNRNPKQGKTCTTGVHGRPSSGILRGADHIESGDMDDHAEFKDHIEMQEYAERSGLDYTWAGTNLFAKRERTLPPDQFEVRPVRTKRGITMVGLFSAAITRAEREAHAPYRDAMAAKRLARMTRAERRNWRGQRRNY